MLQNKKFCAIAILFLSEFAEKIFVQIHGTFSYAFKNLRKNFFRHAMSENFSFFGYFSEKIKNDTEKRKKRATNFL